jgi:predicted metalloprotease with PDZ domain
MGWNGPAIAIAAGRASSASDFTEDWVLTHEMVHLALPSVPEEHHWIEEGSATYVEPVARARAGDLTDEKVWGDLVDGLPKGLPQSDDRGLDFTPTWGRTYWGGALFCLLADIEIRKRTENKKGLEDALRAIVKAGGTIESDWPLMRTLEMGDRGTGVPVLRELYNKMKATPAPVDLSALWKELGVERRNGKTEFNGGAPLAAIRKAITRPKVR